MTYTAAIFDLDGTLADTLADIADAANFALRSVGRPPHAADRYRYLAGQGVDYLIRHALSDPPEADETLVRRAKTIYLERYDAHKYDRTGPFAGVPELLDGLVARGLKLAVLSNKPHEATREMVARLFARWRFDVAVGAKPGAPLKPAPGAAVAVAEAMGVPAGACIYIGDTRADMLTGSGAGMFTVGVLWGFRDEAELRESGADAVIQRPEELLALVDAG